MTKVVTPPTPESVTYICDRCEEEIRGGVDARIELMSRDFQGGIVGSREYHLCQKCRMLFAYWLEGREVIESE